MSTNGNSQTNKLLKNGLVGFYLIAGSYHFINPEFYYGLIPDYFPYPRLINTLSGLFEISLAIGVLMPKTQRLAAGGIISLLILFIPSHVYFIQIGACVEDGLCVSPWIAWIRLILIHPLLILWAYWVGFKNLKT